MSRFHYTVGDRKFSVDFPDVNWEGAVFTDEKEDDLGDLWHGFQLADGRRASLQQVCYDDEHSIYRCKRITVYPPGPVFVPEEPKRKAWPKSVPEQVRAVQYVMQCSLGSRSAPEVAAHFKGDRVEVVRQILDAMCITGNLAKVDCDRYVYIPRSR